MTGFCDIIHYIFFVYSKFAQTTCLIPRQNNSSQCFILQVKWFFIAVFVSLLFAQNQASTDWSSHPYSWYIHFSALFSAKSYRIQSSIIIHHICIIIRPRGKFACLQQILFFLLFDTTHFFFSRKLKNKTASNKALIDCCHYICCILCWNCLLFIIEHKHCESYTYFVKYWFKPRKKVF